MLRTGAGRIQQNAYHLLRAFRLARGPWESQSLKPRFLGLWEPWLWHVCSWGSVMAPTCGRHGSMSEVTLRKLEGQPGIFKSENKASKTSKKKNSKPSTASTVNPWTPDHDPCDTSGKSSSVNSDQLLASGSFLWACPCLDAIETSPKPTSRFVIVVHTSTASVRSTCQMIYSCRLQ